MEKRIYLDAAATTAPHQKVTEKMRFVLENVFGNPSAVHTSGRKARAVVEESREKISSRLGISPSEFFFTGSGTEANNLSILGVAAAKGKGHILTTAVEHPSVAAVIDHLEKNGFDVTRFIPDKSGVLDADKFLSLLRPDTFLVSVMGVNNETGVIHPLEEIGKQLPENVIFHSDLVQAFGKIPFDLKKANISLATFSAHKIHGPKGIGGLYIRSGTQVNPVLFGGGQELNRRPGTENTVNIAGFAVAVEEMPEADIAVKLSGLFETELTGRRPEIVVNCSAAPRAGHISNLRFPGVSGDSLLVRLDMAGIDASMGSACSSGAIKPGKTLTALGYSEEEALSSVRFSFSSELTEKNILDAVEIIVNLLNKLKPRKNNNRQQKR